jgi:hypothetical protein
MNRILGRGSRIVEPPAAAGAPTLKPLPPPPVRGAKNTAASKHKTSASAWACWLHVVATARGQFGHAGLLCLNIQAKTKKSWKI